MGKRMICLLLAAGMLLSLGACGKNGAIVSNNGSSKENVTENASKYMSLVGQKEKEVVAALGEGEGSAGGSNTAQSSAVRQYTDEVYGAQASCAVLLNEDQVTMVYITYAPGDMHFKTLLRMVTEDYGKPDSKSEGEVLSGDDSATAQWQLEDGSIFIYETVDGCGMQIAS